MIGPKASLASPRELPDSEPRVTLTSGGLRVEWNAAAPQINTDSDGFAHIEVPGYELLDLPGVPRLPYSSVLVAIPPSSDPVLEVLAASEIKRIIDAPLVLGSQPEGVELDAAGQVIGGAFTASSEVAADVFQAVSLEPIGVLRGVHLARLSFYPVIPNGDTLRVISSLEVEVNFGPAIQSSTPIETISDPMHDLVGSAVINPEQLQIAAQDQPFTTPYLELQLAETNTVAVSVSSRGITDITYAGLAATGVIDSPVNLDNVSLTRAGINIAYDVVGDSDSNFEIGEKIRFFADPRFSRWTASDTYFLNLDSPGGVQMGSRDADPDGLSTGTPWTEAVFEKNEIYTPACYCAPIPAGRDGDRWVGYKLQRPGEPSQNIPFELPGFDRTENAYLNIWLIGFTDVSANPDHKVNVAIKVFNGENLVQTVDIGTIQFNGKSSHQADFTIPNTLSVGNYQLSLTIPSDTPGVPVDGVWLDAFSIRYALDGSISAGESITFNGADPNFAYSVSLASSAGFQAYEISNPGQPKKLTGAGKSGSQITVANNGQSHDYWVTTTSAIQSPDNLRPLTKLSTAPGFKGADYVIISQAEFIPSLTPLVAMHKSNGLGVVVEDVQAIYDAYSGGRSLPTAIRDYLADAYFNWNSTPLYVLLVGDGTHDPKNYRDTSSATYIPPFLEDVDPWAGETAADNRYVTLDGGDALPDMLIGRLPANNIAELETMVSKIVEYAEKPSPEPWQHQAVFVADNRDFGGGNFPLMSDTLINKLPANSLAAQRLYFSSNYTPVAFQNLVNQVWDDGNGLIMFTGHSSIHQWAHEILFHLDDVPGLENKARLPVVLEMTCFTGSFQIHDLTTLDEELLRKPGGGAVAVWGATGLGIATGHHWLAEGFMETIYQDGTSEIGKAILAGKLNLASIGSNPDLIDTFTLLGDPATKLERSFQLYVPLTNN